MAIKTAARGAQWPMLAEFVFSFNDTAKDINGVSKSFGSTFGDAIVFDCLNLPNGAFISGGELVVEIPGAGPTAYTAKLDTSTGTALLAATDLKAAANTITAFTGKGLVANDGANVRLTIASTVANATAGKARVRVMYTIDNRQNEVNPN